LNFCGGRQIHLGESSGTARFVTGVRVQNPIPTPPYSLLNEILVLRQMTLQPMYTIRDVAKLFGVTVRSIQSRVASGQLAARNLPGRAKFLSVDLEEFLRESKRGGSK
jgi:hypothetical protein